jgi:hypothetical protein
MEEQNNDIQRKAVGELLDGRTFVIPSYQRGYRWKKKQVIDLLNDLYSFACKVRARMGSSIVFNLSSFKRMVRVSGKLWMDSNVLPQSISSCVISLGN